MVFILGKFKMGIFQILYLSIIRVSPLSFLSGHCEPHKKLRGGFEFIAEIPKTASGKLLRRTLRDRAKHQVGL